MSSEDDIKGILIEIRDTQREALTQQKQHIEIARQQMERARAQVTESIELQKQAVARAKSVLRVVLPLIAICIVLILYLTIRYL